MRSAGIPQGRAVGWAGVLLDLAPRLRFGTGFNTNTPKPPGFPDLPREVTF